MTREIGALLDSFRAYKDGFLPAPGAWMDQSRVWTRWVRIIDAEIGVIEEDRLALERARRG